jgi:Uma2 family endonuclease
MDLFHASTRNVRPRRVDNSPDPVPPAGGWAEWYLRDEDDVGESTEQGLIVRELLSALIELVRERGWTRTLVAGDQFFAWIPGEPLVRISPDVYLLEHPPEYPLETPPDHQPDSLLAPFHRHPAMWRTWLPGQVAPRFAVEVVSEDWAKDYVHAPRKYAQLGTRELVVFDPDSERRNRRVALQLFRRDATGHLVRVAAGAAPVHSEELGAWLVVKPHPGGSRLRIARDPAGLDLVPTMEERANALAATNAALVAQAQAQATRADTLAAHAQAQAARAEAEAARAEALATQLGDQAALIAELTAALAARDRSR